MKLFVFLFALIVIASAAEDDATIQKQLRDGAIQFTSKMFTEVVKNNPEKSVVLSAYSVLQPLAQLSLAAVGESHDELLNAIGLPDDNVTRAVFPLASAQLKSVKGVELKLASKVYIPVGYALNEQFAADSKQVFDSEVTNIDFTKSVDAANEINAWVEEQTNHRIKDLVEPDSLDSLTRAVLVNAIYFKGNWKTKFDAAATTDRDFHVTNTKTIQLPTMYKKGDFKYGESKELDAKILELPYEGDEVSMVILLPNQIEGLAALQEKIKDPAVLAKAVRETYTLEVEVYLPRFKIETTTDLKDVLTKMGVGKIFNERAARLEHLLNTEEPLYVSKATQKAFIEVNEDGAEAAAANDYEVVVDRLSIIEQKLKFIADRPFYFELRTKELTLFEGIMYNLVTIL